MDSVSFINKNKNKVFNVVLIIVALFFAWNIYKKQIVKIDILKSDIIEEEKKNRALKIIGVLGGKVDSYRRLLVKKEVSFLMNDINNIAREAGVNIISIKPSGEEQQADYVKYNFDLTVSASDYDGLAKFINALEVNKSVYMVDVLEIRSNSYNREKELNANLRVSAVAMLE